MDDLYYIPDNKPSNDMVIQAIATLDLKFNVSFYEDMIYFHFDDNTYWEWLEMNTKNTLINGLEEEGKQYLKSIGKDYIYCITHKRSSLTLLLSCIDFLVSRHGGVICSEFDSIYTKNKILEFNY